MGYEKLPNVLVFASGSKTGGGSGFEVMVKATRSKPRLLRANICGVISNHASGGVAEKAKRLGIKFMHWGGPFSARSYQDFVRYYNAD